MNAPLDPRATRPEPHLPEAQMHDQARAQLACAKTEEPPRQAPSPGAGPSLEAAAIAALARAAAAGDQRAWEALVTRFTPALRAAARGFRLAPADVDDVLQATWLAALRHIGRLQKPEALGAWLLVTARRESLRSLQRGVREFVTDDPPCPVAPEAESPERVVIESERRGAVEAALRRLPRRQRLLLSAQLSRPGSSYAELSTRLDMPVGSIGPTRERAIGRLRRDRRLAELLSDESAA
jgi:RNA polymerase sigma factor (sigma-70 family)